MLHMILSAVLFGGANVYLGMELFAFALAVAKVVKEKPKLSLGDARRWLGALSYLDFLKIVRSSVVIAVMVACLFITDGW